MLFPLFPSSPLVSILHLYFTLLYTYWVFSYLRFLLGNFFLSTFCYLFSFCHFVFSSSLFLPFLHSLFALFLISLVSLPPCSFLSIIRFLLPSSFPHSVSLPPCSFLSFIRILFTSSSLPPWLYSVFSYLLIFFLSFLQSFSISFKIFTTPFLTLPLFTVFDSYIHFCFSSSPFTAVLPLWIPRWFSPYFLLRPLFVKLNGCAFSLCHFYFLFCANSSTLPIFFSLPFA